LQLSRNLSRDTAGARIFIFWEIFLLLYTDIPVLQRGPQQLKLGSLFSDSKCQRHNLQMVETWIFSCSKLKIRGVKCLMPVPRFCLVTKLAHLRKT
jgi:hypothetical protein